MNWWRMAGMLLQGLILGALLFGATVFWLTLETGARIFRYQNF